MFNSCPHHAVWWQEYRAHREQVLGARAQDTEQDPGGERKYVIGQKKVGRRNLRNSAYGLSFMLIFFSVGDLYRGITSLIQVPKVY